MIDPKLVETAEARIQAAASPTALNDLRVEYIGRKGLVTLELRALAVMTPGERAKAGAKANKARDAIEAALNRAEKRLRDKELASEVADSSLDLTAPVPFKQGHLHPVGELMDELITMFWQMGYQVATGPEIETEWYNFEALGIPADHPARDMQDTFYLEGGNLPRTHTSSVQIRYMEDNKPPIRIIAPGKVYRNEDEDARHLWMFQQLEGLVVDKGITIGDLKGTLLAMVKGILGDETEIRLRPNYFPYTEPSIEVDATCVICKGKGCNTCSGTGWLELLGSGMVHPQVLRNVGIDPEIYSGFAFGLGLERLAAVKYQIPDIREFWRPDLKFLEQF